MSSAKAAPGAKVAKATTIAYNPISVTQPKYCSNCGEECANCTCGCCNSQSVNITFTFNTWLLNMLLSSLPKINISSNRCSKCGHVTHSGECDCGCEG